MLRFDPVFNLTPQPTLINPVRPDSREQRFEHYSNLTLSSALTHMQVSLRVKGKRLMVSIKSFSILGITCVVTFETSMQVSFSCMPQTAYEWDIILLQALQLSLQSHGRISLTVGAARMSLTPKLLR